MRPSDSRSGALGAVGGAALHEADADAGARVLKKLQVLDRPLGRADFQRHVVAGEDVAVFLGVELVRPALRARGDDDLRRWRRRRNGPAPSTRGWRCRRPPRVRRGRAGRSRATCAGLFLGRHGVPVAAPRGFDHLQAAGRRRGVGDDVEIDAAHADPGLVDAGRRLLQRLL